MRFLFILAMAITALATTAGAYQSCTTNCYGSGAYRTCTRSCF